MATRNKYFGVEFEGWLEVLDRLRKLEGDIKPTMEKAMKATHAHITPNLHKEMVKHRRTGRTESSIIDEPLIEWSSYGDTGIVYVGFDISNKGLASVFLMYGTPRMEPDNKLRNAIFSSRVRGEVADIMSDVFYDALRKSE